MLTQPALSWEQPRQGRETSDRVFENVHAGLPYKWEFLEEAVKPLCFSSHWIDSNAHTDSVALVLATSPRVH